MNNNDKEFEEIKAWRHCEELRKREIGWTITLSSLEEENEKLKEKFTDYQKWARHWCELLEDENARLKEELQTFKDRWIGT